MVALAQIKRSNSAVLKRAGDALVCVFAGATSGIGLATLRQMATMLPPSSTFYILCRSSHSFSATLSDLQSRHTGMRFIPIELQFSQIRQVDRACEQIIKTESKVDVVCASTGGVPLLGATYTPEGLETNFAISYYSRLRLVQNLLPLLRQAPSPRVMSILNGTLERPINEQDIGLAKKWSILGLINHATLCTSLAFDFISKQTENQGISFLHTTPGWVRTHEGQAYKTAPPTASIFWRASVVLSQMLGRAGIRVLGITAEEFGARHAYLLTTDTIRKGGAWLADSKCNVVADNETVRRYRERGWAQKIWDHTLLVFEQATRSG